MYNYFDKIPDTVLKLAENEKKLKYGAACEARHANFTPLCMSVDGLLGTEVSSFTNRLADRLAIKWDKSYPDTLFCIRSKFSFAIIRTTNLCIRGSRTKWWGIGFEDGTSIMTS